MPDADDFDAFYQRSRARLLVQTYALTGDLPASRAAVRDSFVSAWHHWPKVRRLEDPESWVRPHAWNHALRRHTARVWHREKHLDDGLRATLDALGKLPVVQRKALLLTHLSAVSREEMAREVGLPLTEAEQRLQTATAQFALTRDVPTTDVRALFDQVAEAVAETRWPRATIVRRSGAARRRAHTAAGAALVVGVLLASGTVVTDASGVQASLARQPRHHATPGMPSGSPTDDGPPDISAADLMSAPDLHAVFPARRWSVGQTRPSDDGRARALPCQQTRLADPDATWSLVRTFEASAKPGLDAVQAGELSRDQRHASAAYRTELGWYAGCAEPRAQLLGVRQVTGVGDHARQFVLRSWASPVRTLVVGVAQTGAVTTTTVTSVDSTAVADVGRNTRLLARAVESLCRVPGAGACTHRPRSTPVPPPPAGDVPAMLSEWDLPPVMGVDKAWVGTQARKALSNAASTQCDQTSFSGKHVHSALTRSFLIPGSRVSDAFGLTETVGRFTRPGARALVAGVRKDLAGCEDRQLGTKVSQVTSTQTPRTDLTVWRVDVKISDQQTVTYLMAIARRDRAVAQLGFVPDRHAVLRPGAFVTLARRALDRLGELR